jgi:hypothetical protein
VGSELFIRHSGGGAAEAATAAPAAGGEFVP